MCGICGVLNLDGAPVDPDIVRRMTDTLIHRGPDQGAIFVDGNLGLGNRRLAILDTSDAGSLPMSDGDLTIAFNGEIYNHPDIRRELEGRGVRDWHTTGDTETILKCYREYDGDIARVLNRLRGMFAFALWDGTRRRLVLARDRMGEKPLYFALQPETGIVFGSEIKAILAHPSVVRRSTFDPGSLMRKTLAHYLADGYFIRYTPFLGVMALETGCYLDLTHDFEYDPKAFATAYYHIPEPTDAAAVPEAEWRDQTLDTLSDAVRGCLISDVPLGAFLSGGLDSSLIVALMRKHSNAAIKTFSIGFAGDASFDETAHAQRVAQHLGTEHTAFTVEAQALDLIPKLVWHHDQPFADSSAIPTYLVSKLTREHVTVALTGDGGDELFVGYERFYAAALALQMQKIVPRPAWTLANAALSLVPEGTGYYNPLKRARRFVRGAAQPLADAYHDWIRVFNAQSLRRIAPDVANVYVSGLVAGADDLPKLVRANMISYLPGDLLVKTDRCSMAASLETRAPFLDHRLVELAARMPMNLKLKGSTTKYILKQAASGLLPDDIIHRPKHGFGVPIGTWLRKDMRPACDILLSPEARGRGLLNMSAVERLIREHADGARDHGGRLWALLTLEWWHRLFIDPPVIAPPS
jgi:asparagine synthase (glutamine-hydrolysing)